MVIPNNIEWWSLKHIDISPQGNMPKITHKLKWSMIIAILFCKKTVICPEDFLIVAESSCNFKLEIQENILIKLLKLTLNKKWRSQYHYICFDITIDTVIIHYLEIENRRSNLINIWFISLKALIKRLFKLAIFCVKVFFNVRNVKYHK